MGPVLLPQRQLDSHWLLLCGNSSPRLLAISISRKRQKSLPIFNRCLKTNQKYPITWAKRKLPVHWVQPRGYQFTTSGLCLARKLLLRSKKWGPQGFPPHTNTLSQQKLLEAHRAYSPLTGALGEGRSSNGLWSKPTLGNRPIAGRLPPPATKRRPGTLVGLTRTTSLEWLTLHSQPQAVQTFLPLSSGPEQFQQHPTSQGRPDSSGQLCRRSQSKSPCGKWGGH